MYELRWAISVVAAVVSVLVIIGNPVIGFLTQRRGGHYSAVPMVGASVNTQNRPYVIT